MRPNAPHCASMRPNAPQHNVISMGENQKMNKKMGKKQRKSKDEQENG
jgi:hypothetical protein